MMIPAPSDRDELANPYAAPAAEIGGLSADFMGDTEAEAIRHAHINHEASVKAVGFLNYLGAAATLLAAGFLLAIAGGLVDPGELQLGDPRTARVIAAALGAFALGMAGLGFAIGYGLRRLQPWARWVEAVLMGFQILLNLLSINPIGLIFAGYFLYLMLAAKSNVVFSPSYKAVIAQTPHIRYRMSPVVKVFLVILLVVIGLAILGAILAALLGH